MPKMSRLHMIAMITAFILMIVLYFWWLPAQ